MVWGIVRGANAGWFESRQPIESTITLPDGAAFTWEVYHDPLPLRVEDLLDVDYDDYSYEWTARESFFLAQYIARQRSFPFRDGHIAPELGYSIVDVKVPALFGLCLDDYLNQYNEWAS
jgi:hypothetical protein